MAGPYVITRPTLGFPMRDPNIERVHLERAHHEICTALTILQSNVELIRLQLSHDPEAGDRIDIRAHLSDVDLAVDRLRRLAGSIRAWHADEPSGVHAPSEAAR